MREEKDEEIGEDLDLKRRMFVIIARKLDTGRTNATKALDAEDMEVEEDKDLEVEEEEDTDVEDLTQAPAEAAADIGIEDQEINIDADPETETDIDAERDPIHQDPGLHKSLFLLFMITVLDREVKAKKDPAEKNLVKGQGKSPMTEVEVKNKELLKVEIEAKILHD